MFKKPITIASKHKVSGSDRKKLRKALISAFPQADEEGLNAFLPIKDGELSLAKVQSSRTSIYFLDGVPILVDSWSKGDFFPTVYALWKAPTILPTVTVKHPAVTKFLVGGADLMLPGVDTELGIPLLKKGDICAVLSPGNPAPLAVGEVAIASDDVDLAAGKGRFLMAMHHFGDCLWACTDNPSVPNNGFHEDGVGPIAGEEQGLEGAHSDVDGTGAQSGGHGAEVMEELQHKIEALSAVCDADAGDASGALECSDQQDDMDTLLGKSLLQALHKTLDDSMLPIAGGKLWSEHMLPNRPPGSHLDLKKSSFKKLSKFLKSRKDIGLLSCKEDKHNSEIMVTKVNRNHAAFTDYTPYTSTESTEELPPQVPEDVPSSSDSSQAIAPLVMEEVFTTGGQKEVGIIFGSIIGPDYKNECFTANQVRDVVRKYVADNNLEQDGTIELNPQLCDALFKGVLKKSEKYPTHLPSKLLDNAFLRRMLPQQRITRGGAQAQVRGSLPPISLQTKKRQGSKKPFLIDARQFASHVQRACACAASCTELEGSKNKNCFEVIIQGDKASLVAGILAKEYGVPARFIQGGGEGLGNK